MHSCLTLFVSALWIIYSEAADNDVCSSSLWTAGNLTTEYFKASSNNKDLDKIRATSTVESTGWCGSNDGNNSITIDFPKAIGVGGIIFQQPKITEGGVRTISVQYVGDGNQVLQSILQKDINLNGQARGSRYTIKWTGIVMSKLIINILQYDKPPCIQVDVLGCAVSALCPQGCKNGGKCVQQNRCVCTMDFSGEHCEISGVPSGHCLNRQGMQDRRIPEASLTVSSSDSGHNKNKARLNCCQGEQTGGWCAKSDDRHPWYEVKFSKPTSFSGIEFQPPANREWNMPYDNFVKHFILKYISSQYPLKSWRTFAENVPGIANKTVDKMIVALQPKVTVDAIRIYPTEWQNKACMRFEVLGCDPGTLCSNDYCKNGGKCIGEDICECVKGYYGAQCQTAASTLTTYSIHFKQITTTTITTSVNIAFHITGTVKLIPMNGNQVLSITGHNNYVTVDGNGFRSCLKNIDSCENGFTLNIKVQFRKLLDNTYIVSSGGDLSNGKGLALYYSNGKIYYVVSTSTQIWRMVANYTFKLNVWNHLELSWSKTLGVEVLNNGALIGSAIKWIQRHPPTITQHQLTIGYGFQKNVEISILIQGLQTFDIQRTEVVHQDLLTTTTPTTSVSIPTTTSQTSVSNCTSSKKPVKSINFAFIGIADNILITPLHNFSVFGHPFLAPEKDGGAILILNKTGHYVELPNTGLECLQDLTTCDKGFTLSVEIKIYKINTTNKNYIFSSGGDKVNSSGIALYLWKGELYCSTKWNRQIWTAKTVLNVKNNEWHNYQVSWNEKNGFIVYIDGILFMKNTIHLPNPVQDETHPLLIAKGFGSNLTTLMDIRNLYAWTASRDVLICEHVLQEYTTPEPATAQAIISTTSSTTNPPTTTTTTTTTAPTTTTTTTTTTAPTTTTTTTTTTAPTTTPIPPTTTTAKTIPTFEWSFAHLTSNTLITGNQFQITVYGGATINNTLNSLHITNTSQYIDFGNHTNLCLSNLDLCTGGVTFEITVSFSKLEENTVIMTSGGENPLGTGIALVYKFGSIQCVVSQTKYSWFAFIPREKIILQTFASIIVSWKPDKGLILYIGNKIVDYSTVKIPHHAISTTTQHLYLGPAPTSSLVMNSVDVNFYLKSFKCWHIWIDIAINIGIIVRPPSWATTQSVTTVTTTKIPAAKPTSMKPTVYPSTKSTMSTQMCKSGWICTDDLSTTVPTTTTTVPKTTTRRKTTSTTTTTTTTPRPTKPGLPSYTRPPTLTTGVDGNNVAFFRCHFKKTLEQNVEFIVTLNINGNQKNWFVVPGFSDEYKFTIDKINENLNNKKITCLIQARFIGEKEMTSKLPSNTITPSITLLTASKLNLIEGITTPQIIQVHTTAPPQMFCCSGCKGQCTVTIQAHVDYDRHDTKCNSFIIPQMIVGWKGQDQSSKPEVCGSVMHQTNWNQIIKIPVSATVDNLYDRDHSNTFTVQAQVVNRPQPPIVLVSTTQTFTLGHVQVVAKDNDHKAMCTSLNDPHMTTFDGRRYDNFNTGEFTLYKHKELPYEVRAQYQYCGNRHHRTRPTCNCAVAIKSGDDVITFSSCAEYAVYSRHHHSHGPAPITVRLYKNGELTPGTRIRRLGCGQKYEVHLPTGTIITIQSSARPYINIWVKPSSVDYGRTEGLCGLYDRNRQNDVVDNNGHHIRDSERHPDVFSLKWKQSSSIFTGVAASTVPGITKFCSCIRGKQTFCVGGHSVMRCLEIRNDITSMIVRQARQPILRSRTKRQAASGQEMNVIPNDRTYTHEEAVEECRNYIESSPATKTCSKVVNSADVDERIQNCAIDLESTGSNVWKADSLKDIIEECLAEAYRTPVQNSSVVPDANSTFLCSEDCGENGHCEQGVCQCNSGYSGLNCSLSKSTKPTVFTTGTDVNGCDTRNEDNGCDTATILGSDFVQSDDLTCHYQYITVSNKVYSHGGIKTTPAEFINMNQVSCQLLDKNRGAYIWISNDGTTKSDDVYLHLVYDSQCFDCSVENDTANSYCSRLDNRCIINGECHVPGDTKSTDKYKVCDPSTSFSAWTDTCSEDPVCSAEVRASKQNADDDLDRTKIIILAVVCGILGFGLCMALIYICRSRSKPSKETGSYNISKRRNQYQEQLAPQYENPSYNF